MRYLARLRRALGTGAAVVHTNGFKMHVLGALARPRGSAVLWHIHDYISPRRVMSTLLRRVLGRCSAIVANSHSVASDVRDALGSDITIYPVWNAVDLNRFRSAGPQLDLDALSELASAGNVLRVGLVATFARWKGHQTFLTALSMLPSSLPVRGYIIGGPVYETAGSQVSIDELRRHATALGLESRVGFTGFVEDTAAAMRSLDVVVHASTEPEPFGLVIAEAMACRKPIVVSRAGGAMEIAQPLVNAMAHEPGNARDLARCLERLANEPALRQRIADAGRATAEKAFTRQRLALEMTSIYESMASAN
jgi:glycosyltransferase involved in cell wall biosynthesis